METREFSRQLGFTVAKVGLQRENQVISRKTE